LGRARAAAVLVALAVRAAGAAHATLTAATPREQSRIDEAPTEITLRYDQAVTATPDSIVVLAPSGRRVSGIVTQSDGNTVIRAPLHGLVAGQAYTVRWH
jgi:copper transport protein